MRDILVEWMPDEFKKSIRTAFLKAVEKYNENPNAEHEYLKYRDKGIINNRGDRPNSYIKEDKKDVRKTKDC